MNIEFKNNISTPNYSKHLISSKQIDEMVTNIYNDIQVGFQALYISKSNNLDLKNIKNVSFENEHILNTILKKQEEKPSQIRLFTSDEKNQKTYEEVVKKIFEKIKTENNILKIKVLNNIFNNSADLLFNKHLKVIENLKQKFIKIKFFEKTKKIFDEACIALKKIKDEDQETIRLIRTKCCVSSHELLPTLEKDKEIYTIFQKMTHGFFEHLKNSPKFIQELWKSQETFDMLNKNSGLPETHQILFFQSTFLFTQINSVIQSIEAEKPEIFKDKDSWDITINKEDLIKNNDNDQTDEEKIIEEAVKQLFLFAYETPLKKPSIIDAVKKLDLESIHKIIMQNEHGNSNYYIDMLNKTNEYIEKRLPASIRKEMIDKIIEESKKIVLLKGYFLIKAEKKLKFQRKKYLEKKIIPTLITIEKVCNSLRKSENIDNYVKLENINKYNEITSDMTNRFKISFQEIIKQINDNIKSLENSKKNLIEKKLNQSKDRNAILTYFLIKTLNEEKIEL